MIDLKEKFGKKYKILFDRERYSANINIIPVEKRDWYCERPAYYYIPCRIKKSIIEPYDDSDELVLYCYSIIVGKRIYKNLKEYITDFDMARDCCIIRFNIEHAEKFFKEIKPKKKRKVNPEQIEVARKRFLEYHEKKKREKEEIENADLPL